MTNYERPMTGALTIYPTKPYLREDVIKSLLEQANKNAEVINNLMHENLELYHSIEELKRRINA